MRATVLVSAVMVVLAAVPASAQREQESDSKTCFSTGSENYKKEEFIERGIRACTRLIKVRTGKSLATAYAARGYWYTKQDELEKAMDDLNDAVDIDPKNVEFYDYRADIYMARGQYERALTNYKQSIRVDPKYAPAHYGAGRAYEKMGKLDLARESYEDALAAPTKDRIGEWAQRSARAALDAMKK